MDGMCQSDVAGPLSWAGTTVAWGATPVTVLGVPRGLRKILLPASGRKAQGALPEGVLV